jgi:hypothetical protein
MTLVQKMISALTVVAMSLGMLLAISGTPVSAVVCESSTGGLYEAATCPTGEDTTKAAACDSLVRLGDKDCLDVNSTTAENNIVGIAKTIINILSLIIGIAAVIVIIISGFRFITSGGESSAVAGARQGILYAIIGLVVVIFAQAIVAFVLNRL